MNKLLKALIPASSIIMASGLFGFYLSAVLGYANLALAFIVIAIVSFLFLVACASSETLSGNGGKESHRDQ